MAIDEDLIKELDKPLVFEKKDEKEYKDVKVAESKESKYDQTLERDVSKEDFFSKVIEFTTKIKKMYGDLIKSVLIFGSAARGDMKKTSDIDLWVIVDDTATKNTEDVNRIRMQLQVIANEIKGLHIQSTALTEFWNWMKVGSPELFNYLRSGLIIYDTGFIKPVQKMLKMGLLPPSEETAGLKARSSQTILKRVEATLKTMVFDLRYAATDACQAVVMFYYKETPDQKNMSEFLKRLVKDKKLEAPYVKKFEELNKIWKDIDHGIIKEVNLEHLKKAMTLSKSIVERMKKLLPTSVTEYDVGFGGLF